MVFGGASFFSSVCTSFFFGAEAFLARLPAGASSLIVAFLDLAVAAAAATLPRVKTSLVSVLCALAKA